MISKGSQQESRVKLLKNLVRYRNKPTAPGAAPRVGFPSGKVNFLDISVYYTGHKHEERLRYLSAIRYNYLR
jgi:hypothetical protein